MKTALYTIFRCTNYGAVLQAYALARVLRGFLGEDAVDVVNHRMDPRDTHLLGKITNPNTPWFQRWRNRRKFAARYYRPDLFELRRARTIRLVEDFVRPTERLYRSPGELKDLPRYATVVVGSDQVWNPALNNDFGHNPYLGTDLPEGQDRVAYAASFGVSELPDGCRAEYASALSKFRKITVREETGAEICRNILPPGGDRPPANSGDRPPVVLDPTLLLTAKNWREAVGTDPGMVGTDPASRGEWHVAAYWVRTFSAADADALARIAAEIGAPVRLMSAGPLPKLDFPPEIVPCVDVDPFGFVRTVTGSCAVVTDSFHGLQFAALFRRPFLALGNVGDAKSNASRLVDFCRRYGLPGAVQDIEAFRRGEAHPLAEFPASGLDALASDRDRSLDVLRGMLPTLPRTS